MLKVSKKSLTLALFCVAIIGAFIFVGLFFQARDSEPQQQDVNGNDNNTVLDEAALNQQAEEEFNDNLKMSREIASFEDYKKLFSDVEDETDPLPSDITLLAIERMYTEEPGDEGVANSIVQDFTKNRTNSALQAAVLCYRYTTSDEQKNICYDRANTIANELGILSEGMQQLPESYFVEKNGDE